MFLCRIAIDPIFPPPPVPNSKKHLMPDAMDNRFELVYNDRDDAQDLKNLPIGKQTTDSSDFFCEQMTTWTE